MLEHLRRPLDVLAAITGAMVDGGILYVSVPDFDALPEHGDLQYCLNPQGGQIVAYTSECLEGLLARVSLERLDVAGPAQLDAVRTKGPVRRLRVFGQRTAVPVSRPAHPLHAATRVLEEYRRRHGARSRSRLPVRVQAGLAHRDGRRRTLAHRTDRLWRELISPAP